MNIKNNNEDLDSSADEFLSVAQQKYNKRFYFNKLTESKTKLLHFVLRKRLIVCQKLKNKFYLTILNQFQSRFIITVH